jgi:hypothetical protein
MGPQADKARPDRTIEKDRLKLRESGTFVRLTQAGADLFA